MSNVQYDVELNTRLDKLQGQLSIVENNIEKKFKKAGEKSGKSFGSAFSQIATGLIGSISFGTLIVGSLNAVNAVRNLNTTSQVLSGTIAGQNRIALDNQAILKSSKTAIEQKALAMGFDTAELYKNVKATKKALSSTKQLSRSFTRALQEQIAKGATQIDENKIRTKIDELYNRIGTKVGLNKAAFTGVFADLLGGGLRDLDELSTTTEGFIKIASTGTLPLAEGVAQLAQQFRTENAALGERAGLQDEYLSQIGPRGLAMLQAEGKLRGKNFEELSLEEKALAKSAGLRTNIANAQGVFNAKLESGAFDLDKQLVKLEDLKVSIGTGLLPVYSDLIQISSPILSSILAFTTANQSAIPTVLGLTLGVVGLSTVLGVLGGPLTLVVAGIIASSALLKYVWDNDIGSVQARSQEFIEFFQREILPNVKPIIDGLIQLFSKLSPVIKPIFTGLIIFLLYTLKFFLIGLSASLTVIKGVLDVMIGLFEGARRGFEAIFSGFGDIAKVAFNQVLNQVNIFSTMLKSAFNRLIIDNINKSLQGFNEVLVGVEVISGGKIKAPKIPTVPRLAQGGSIIPPGFNNDTFPLFGAGGKLLAMAQSGERIDVVPRNQVNNKSNSDNQSNITNIIYTNKPLSFTPTFYDT